MCPEVLLFGTTSVLLAYLRSRENLAAAWVDLGLGACPALLARTWLRVLDGSMLCMCAWAWTVVSCSPLLCRKLLLTNFLSSYGFLRCITLVLFASCFMAYLKLGLTWIELLSSSMKEAVLVF